MTSMQLGRPTAHVFVPDGVSLEEALARTTHLGIGAHPDDLEFMAWWPIAQCYRKPDLWFTGVTATDGAGSPRSSAFAHHSDEEMRLVRLAEQVRAARLGDYSAILCLDYSSSEVRARSQGDLLRDLEGILSAARPQYVFTHNLADKHDTHVAMALSVLEACRRLPRDAWPCHLYGGEVWRGLDWMPDADKVCLDVGEAVSLMRTLMAVYESQIGGGKRYDLATQGRKRANATYLSSHACDQAEALEYAMDLTPLLADPGLEPRVFVQEFIRRFESDVVDRLTRFGPAPGP